MATASFFPSRELQTFPLQLERRYDGEGSIRLVDPQPLVLWGVWGEELADQSCKAEVTVN